jgi:CubicO group peptidase (beta-lactamase class C family)
VLNNTSGFVQQKESIDKPLKFKPGTAFNYSNIGYYVAGFWKSKAVKVF